MLENRYFLKLFNTNVVAVTDTNLTTMAYVHTKTIEHDVQRVSVYWLSLSFDLSKIRGNIIP